MNISKTSLETTVEWDMLNWRKLERAVFKLQKRIYRASQRGDKRAVQKLQKTLMRSWGARCIAVRKVTQDNKGKNTAGVDRVKSLEPSQRIQSALNLRINHKANPLRRVWIPKPGRDEKADATPRRRKAQDKGFSRMYAHQERPLGIPTIKDRTRQAIAKMALEPEWEAKFEDSSYGFRPGRSAHDAIEHIFIGIGQKKKYALDADIAKCFDKINHAELLRKINTFPKMRRQIKAWLKAGILEGDTLFPTQEGTAQGGVISPLLANISLHGMIEEIRESYPKTKKVEGRSQPWKPIIIRYADDFVVLHPSEEIIHEIKHKISDWLKPMGLTLKEEKTRICHSFHKIGDENPGFDFLGFNIRQFKDNRTRLGFKTIIQPSQKSVNKHVQRLRDEIRKRRNAKVVDLIAKLNPIIRGWANYFRTVCSATTFKRVHHDLYSMLFHWGKRRTGKYKISYQKYWKEIDGKMTFASEAPKGGEPMMLRTHNQVTIKRHVKVQGTKSPYDGDWTYWGKRFQSFPGIKPRVQMLLRRDNAKCNWCGLNFKPKDVWDTDHIIPKIDGGKNELKNLQLLHRHCHHEKTGIENQQRYANKPNVAKSLRSCMQ